MEKSQSPIQPGSVRTPAKVAAARVNVAKARLARTVKQCDCGANGAPWGEHRTYPKPMCPVYARGAQAESRATRENNKHLT